MFQNHYFYGCFLYSVFKNPFFFTLFFISDLQKYLLFIYFFLSDVQKSFFFTLFFASDARKSLFFIWLSGFRRGQSEDLSGQFSEHALHGPWPWAPALGSWHVCMIEGSSLHVRLETKINHDDDDYNKKPHKIYELLNIKYKGP